MRHVGWLVVLLAASAFSQNSRPNSLSVTASGGSLGTVHFRTSCAAAVEPDFDHAIALLHSFEYDEARSSFEQVGRQDPGCAMAKWGEAMSSFHGLWGEYNPERGSRAVLEARLRAAANPKTTARERAYIEAIAEIFSEQARKEVERPANQPDALGYAEPGDEAEVRYKDKMAALHRAFPEDREATIFYALALNITQKHSDKTHANVKECVSLLKPLFAEQPDHPGIAHYLIHCTDNPDMAAQGLDAARKYARIAPASAHATHMPSHIFAQLGLWDEMVQSNIASMKASESDTHASVCQRTNNTLHAMYYLTFSLVQTGRLQQARDTAYRALKVPGATACNNSPGHALAGYAAETGDWPLVKDIPSPGTVDPVVDAMIWETIGVGAARTNNLKRAEEAEQALAKVRDTRAAIPGQARENGPEVNRLAVAAWIAYQTGHREQALATMRQAVDLQANLGGSVSVFKPAQELLADMLLHDGKAKEALTAYEAVLQRHPNRFDSVAGAANAAFESGDRETATRYYHQLLTFAHGDERPELATARKRTTEQEAAAQ